MRHAENKPDKEVKYLSLQLKREEQSREGRHEASMREGQVKHQRSDGCSETFCVTLDQSHDLSALLCFVLSKGLMSIWRPQSVSM